MEEKQGHFYARTSLWAALAAALHLLVVVVVVVAKPNQRAAAEAARIFDQGEALRREGRIADAVDQFERVRRSYGASPAAPAAQYALALHDLMERGDLRSGRTRLASLLEAFPRAKEAAQARRDLDFINRFTTGDSTPAREFFLAMGRIRGGRREAGFVAFEMILLRYPRHPIEEEVLYQTFRAGEALGRNDPNAPWTEWALSHPSYRPYYPEVP